MKKQKIIIVGGGYHGILSALLLSQNKQNEIYIIEQSSALGGLYRTAWSYGDHHFDYGSRCIVSTGIDAIDTVLFELLDEKHFWKQTDSLKEFSFQKGVKFEHSNCLDARLLDAKDYQAGFDELLKIDEQTFKNSTSRNLEEFCNSMFGKIFTKKLISHPFEKLSGLSMKEAHVDALNIYGLNRIIIADRNKSKELKSSSSFNNARIAFSSHSDHKSTTTKAYPKQGGLDFFANRIFQYLASKSNVKIFLSSSIVSADIYAGKVDGVTTDNGQYINCDKLICTIPPTKIANVLDVNLSELTPPKANNLMLAHFLFSGEIQTSAFYHYNYDATYKTRRVTFYNNFSERQKQKKFITVESNSAEKIECLDTIKRHIFDELKASELISSCSEIFEAKTQLINNVLVKPTIDLPSIKTDLREKFTDKINNLTIINESVDRKLEHLNNEFFV